MITEYLAVKCTLLEEKDTIPSHHLQIYNYVFLMYTLIILLRH